MINFVLFESSRGAARVGSSPKTHHRRPRPRGSLRSIPGALPCARIPLRIRPKASRGRLMLRPLCSLILPRLIPLSDWAQGKQTQTST
jgi:hypothetical protein